jgi:hypothetical protein
MIRFTAVRDWARSYQLARWVSADNAQTGSNASGMADVHLVSA